MTLMGYADRLSARPGEQVEVKVSCDEGFFDAALVRFRGSLWPKRPIEPEEFASGFTGTYPGSVQAVPNGSYVRIDWEKPPAFTEGLTWTGWIFPTLPANGADQHVFAFSAPATDQQVRLIIDQDGVLRFGCEERAMAHTAAPLFAGRWYFVAASWDAASTEFRLVCTMGRRAWLSEQSLETRNARGLATLAVGGPLVFGSALASQGDIEFPFACYNGKLDRPSLWSRALEPHETAAVQRGADPLGIGSHLEGSWDFSLDMTTANVVDRSSNHRHGRCRNQPTRAVAGANWTGREVSPKLAAAEYGAIAFHQDDLGDCGWTTDFSWTVPTGLAPGVYGIRLQAGDAVDHVPLYIRGAGSDLPPRILFLAPTNTYLAYGNERLYEGIEAAPDFIQKTVQDPITLTERDEFLVHHPELGSSVYDLHRDKTGVCYSTRMRPVVTMRPESSSWTTGHPRHFSADLFLIEWLEHLGYAYDVATDEDLHREGLAALRDYAVVITGSHPEYWTEPGMDALEAYLSEGGRLMYLGGNGFYWVTGISDAAPHIVEVRRGINGTRAWNSHPGEIHLSTTGELGGLWRNRGRFPNRMVGVGFAAQGWGGAPGYRRLPDSNHPDASFIFAGIGDDEIIGEQGLIMGGAAGDEVDRFDPDLGSPAETLRLATTEGLHSNYYQLVIEDCTFMLPGRGGAEDGRVRADLTYIADPATGGAVFSTGSINWIGSLMWNDAENTVSRLTANVLDRFQNRQGEIPGYDLSDAD